MIPIIKQQAHRIALIFILLALLIHAFYFERIKALGGFGYDGLFYGDYAKYFIQYIKNNYIDSYHFQRVGIPFIIHYAFLFFKIEYTNPNIIHAFTFVNLSFIFFAIAYYFLISKTLILSRNIEIIGFASLFYCFPVLKLCLYCPVLMDIPAFCLSVILVYHYLKNNILSYFILLLIGSFIYPTFVLLSVLFFFKKQDLNIQTEELPKSNKIGTFFKRFNISHFLFCYSFSILLCVIYIVLFWHSSLELMARDYNGRPYATVLIWVSFFIALSYLSYLNYFPKFVFNIKRIFKSINIYGVILVITLIVLTKTIVNFYSSKGEPAFTLQSFLYNIIYQAVKNPFNFMIAHIFYFGFAPLLAFFLIKDLKREISAFGMSMILFFNLFVFFSVGSESRQLLNYYPFFILLLVIILDKFWKVSLTFTILYTIMCIALSHFWYKINTATNLSNQLVDLHPFEFPDQRYFMFQGPWVSDLMYKIHIAICIIILLLFWIAFKKTKLIVRKDENPLQNNK
ncbi:MAG: hypothetical protein H7141_01925 [Burkholderiales bacterium]|nr:hypothetical protein [Bacteroidia bacterium]